MRDQFRGRA